MTSSRLRAPAVWATALALALTLTGCGGGHESAAPRTAPTQTHTSPPAPSGGGAAPAATGPRPSCQDLGFDVAEVAEVTGLALSKFEFANGSCGYTSDPASTVQTVIETASISPGQGPSSHTAKAAAETMTKAGATCTNFQGTMYSCWRPPGAVCLANDKHGRLWQTITGNPFSLTDSSIRSKLTSGCESLIVRVVERANAL